MSLCSVAFILLLEMGMAINGQAFGFCSYEITVIKLPNFLAIETLAYNGGFHWKQKIHIHMDQLVHIFILDHLTLFAR